MSVLRTFVGIVFVVGTLTTTAHARADSENIVNVVDQAKYKMVPYGIRSGSLIFSPGIGVSETYDDNVFGDETNTKSDWITVVSPSLKATTDFDMHQLFFAASAGLGYYKENDKENFEDFSFIGGGRLDLDYATALTLSSAYKAAHETRDSPDDPNADEPIKFSLATQKAQFVRALGVIKLYIDGMYEHFKFEDSTRNGVAVNNGNRDRGIYTIGTKLAYEYFPGYNVYVGTRSDWRKYDENVGVSRDSTGQEYKVGTDLDITGKIKGDLYLGYLIRNYDAANSDIDDFSYGGSLIWNITGLTSITAKAEKSTQESAYRDASGDLETRVSLAVDHVLRHNIFLNANAQVVYSDYDQTIGIKRDDTEYRYGAGIEYMPYNGTSINFGYRHLERDSNIIGSNITDNKLTLSLEKQF